MIDGFPISIRVRKHCTRCFKAESVIYTKKIKTGVNLAEPFISFISRFAGIIRHYGNRNPDDRSTSVKPLGYSRWFTVAKLNVRGQNIGILFFETLRQKQALKLRILRAVLVEHAPNAV